METLLGSVTANARLVPLEPTDPMKASGDHPLLHHPVRQAIVRWVDAHPGGHLGGLVRDLRLGWGNAHHHIDRMRGEGLLVLEQESNRVHLFRPGQVPREERRLFAVLEHDCLRNVVEVVSDHPGINQRRLAEELGITPTAARKHVRRLVEEGILGASRDGRQVHYDVVAGLPSGILGSSARAEDPLQTLSALHGAIGTSPA